MDRPVFSTHKIAMWSSAWYYLGWISLESCMHSQISPLSVYCSSAQGLGRPTAQPGGQRMLGSSEGEVGGRHEESTLVLAACVLTSQAKGDPLSSVSVFSVRA